MNTGRAHRNRQAGFGLIELMISMLLGLLVTGAAIGMFLSNRQTYLATESLGRVQESVRAGFELMARDLRESAGNACGSDVTLVNVLNAPAAAWYSDWADGLRGYEGGTAFPDAAFGAGVGQRVAGTDAIEQRSAVNGGVPIVQHTAASAMFTLNTAAHGFAVGDLAVACDPGHAAILQVTGPAAIGSNAEIVHNTGVGSPGNCVKGLGGEGVPASCTPAIGIEYTFGCLNGDKDSCATAEEKWPAVLARLHASRWYVGHNGRDGGQGRSLFQATLGNNAGAPSVTVREVADGVRDMQIQYLLSGAAAYADADTAWTDAEWMRVVAARISLVVVASDRPAAAGGPVQRRLEHVVTFRNRAP